MKKIILSIGWAALALPLGAAEPASSSGIPPAVTPPSAPVLVDLKFGKITFVSTAGAKISGKNQAVKLGDAIPEKTELETGRSPVTEITFEDGSILRLGEKTKASFLAKERVVLLTQGTALFYAPEGNGGITLKGGQAEGQVSGSTVMSSVDAGGNFSFFVLESSGAGSVTGPSVPTTFLGAGEGTTVRTAGGNAPEVMDLHVDAVRDISPLFQQVPTSLPSDAKVVATTQSQAQDVQMDVKLLSSLENYKLTPTDPEGVALAMICDVGPEEMGAAKNILLRPVDTAAGTEAGSDQGSGTIMGTFSVPVDARQAEAQAVLAASSPSPGVGGIETAAGGDGGGDPGGTDTAAGGGGGTDTQPPLPPVTTSSIAPFTTPF